jgi:hypothetical protein
MLIPSTLQMIILMQIELVTINILLLLNQYFIVLTNYYM